MTSRARLERKQVDDVLGGDDMWKHADSTAGACSSHVFHPWTDKIHNSIQASCPKCDHGRAYFYMLQIRSADEPMTTCEYSVSVLAHYYLSCVF